MNKLDLDYQNLLEDILDNGVKKDDRTGTGTLSMFGRQIRHKMSEGFPLLTTKKVHFKSVVTELLWFLRGDTNIKYLVDNDCHIWDGDVYKKYLNTYKGNFEMDKEEFVEAIKTNPEFAQKWGSLGKIYGAQWRSWPAWLQGDLEDIDQIDNLINDLKTNPDSRRLMVNAWNVGELDQMVLPPCHNLFQMYSVEKEGKRHLSIMVNIRSNDVPLGLPFNIASYGLLLEIIAKSTNMTPDELIINIGDAHIYLNQIEGIKEQLTREPYPLPTLKINSGNENWYLLEIDEIINSFDPDLTFKVENYQSHPSIKLPLSN
jgi:thymidylate synthase